MSRRRKPLPVETVDALIEGLTHEGRGLTHIEGKAVFIDGALPGEQVRFRYRRQRRRFDEGTVEEVLQSSSDRVQPRCSHFGVCGGCSLQHMHVDAQIRSKQESLAALLARIAKISPQTWLPPLRANAWGYRRKARLGVRYVSKKGRTLVGFRERGNAFITDVSQCEVLHPSVGARMSAIASLIDTLTIRDQVPQIEVAMGDDTTVLVFRVLAPPTETDVDALTAFGEREGFRIHLQEGGPESIRALSGQSAPLHYDLPHHDLRLDFLPSDFTQVNLELNRLMVDQALDRLSPQPDDRVLDLFCGLGNFTLPLARRVSEVVGVEGDDGLVARARANAERNGINNVRFHVSDLYGELDQQPWLSEHFSKVLLDPPRSGAIAILDWLPRLGAERILYVSCNPATLARDADRLVNVLGYRLSEAGVMDMFPHTAHVESMAVFDRR
ncbi:23S rRNA (uracil(1939)-C(5))-methyltransferase [Thiocapsa imhoffii]|uniref:23S rRNA (uracil(1939)-C(5))-methyltransferase RlmD n=1 Tax=Thiocapsa imhoffii TaxID=382777 RepID=A0A9X0WJQ1_9GAMM|nr:23S rRNA (uracil(1939)-C(5))-methyltransferase [Thiocapsa imhoffii]